MAIPSESDSSTGTRVPHRLWELLHFTPRARRKLVRGALVTIIFLAFNGVLAVLFCVTSLNYTIAGLSVSIIVIVASIGLTLFYVMRAFSNFTYVVSMSLTPDVARRVHIDGLS